MKAVSQGAMIVASCVLGSRILGIIREMVFARLIGAGAEKSAYDLAFLLPDTLNSLVSTGYLSITFLPIFSAYLLAGHEKKAWRFFSNTLLVLGGLLSLCCLIAWIFAEPLLKLLVQSHPEPQLLSQAVFLCRIILPAQVFFFMGAILTAIQHSRQRFFIPAFSGIVYNLFIIAGGVLGAKWGVTGFAWGVFLGALCGNGLLQVFGAQIPFKNLRFSFNVFDPDLHRYVLLTLPLMLSLGAVFSLEFTYRSFGFQDGADQVALLGYAYRLAFAGVGILGYSAGVASYPQLVKWAQEKQHKLMGQLIWRGYQKILMIALLLMLMLSTAALPLVRLLLERGAFTFNDSLAVAHYLQVYAWILPLMSAQALVLRGWYARQQFWRPSLFQTSIFILSLPLYHFMIPRWGTLFIPLLGVTTTFIQLCVLSYPWMRPPYQDSQKDKAIFLFRLLLCILLGWSVHLLLIKTLVEPLMINNHPSLAYLIFLVMLVSLLHLVSQLIFWKATGLSQDWQGNLLPSRIKNKWTELVKKIRGHQ